MMNESKIVSNITDAPKKEGDMGTRTVTDIEKTAGNHYYQMEWGGSNEI